MSSSEYIRNINNSRIDEKKVMKVSKAYGMALNDTVSKIVSFAGKGDFFDDDRRALSYDEIVNPKKYMGIDFISKRLIPLIDVYDNTYLVYSFEDKKYALYSATDALTFKKRAKFEDLI